MSRLTTFYDRYAERWDFSLGGAIACAALYAFMIYLRYRDPFYIYMAPLTLLVGVVGLFHGIQVICAVRRRTTRSRSCAAVRSERQTVNGELVPHSP